MDKDTTTFYICFILLCWPFFFGIYAAIRNAISNSIDKKIRIKCNQLHREFKKLFKLMADTSPEDYSDILSALPDALDKEDIKFVEQIAENVAVSLENKCEIIPNLNFAFGEFVVEVINLDNNHHYTLPAKCLTAIFKEKTYYFLLEFHFRSGGRIRFYQPKGLYPGSNKTLVNFDYYRLCVSYKGEQFKIKLLRKDVEDLLMVNKKFYKNFRKDNT